MHKTPVSRETGTMRGPIDPVSRETGTTDYSGTRRASHSAGPIRNCNASTAPRPGAGATA